MGKSKYQTLSEFVFSPFNNSANLERDTKYSTMYNNYKNNNKIYLKATTQVESSYYYLIKVPSESQKSGNIEYDVVIRFFTDSGKEMKSPTLRNYYIQFFSNSPSFIYQYAYIYNKRGYLAEMLYDKLDANYINTPPSKTNPDGNLSYDKSIYFACRFLASEQFKMLNKPGWFQGKLVKPDQFFPLIKDFETAKITQDITNAEKQVLKELEKSKDKKKEAGLESKKAKVKSTMNSINFLSKNKPVGKKHKVTAKRNTFK